MWRIDGAENQINKRKASVPWRKQKEKAQNMRAETLGVCVKLSEAVYTGWMRVKLRGDDSFLLIMMGRFY